MTRNFQDYTIAQITNFFENEASAVRLLEEELSSLIQRINHLAISEPIIRRDARVILVGLSGFNRDTYLLKSRLETARLVTLRGFSSPEAENFYDIINIIKACADLSYDKAELPWNTAAFPKLINPNLRYFYSFPKAALSLLHAFAKLGYDHREENLAISFKKLVLATRNGMIVDKERKMDFGPKDAADLIHSLAKLGMFEEIFDEQGNLTQLAAKAKTLMQDNYRYMNQVTANALLQADSFCRHFYHRPFFDNKSEERIIETLRSKCPPETVSLSNLHNNSEQELFQMGYSFVEREVRVDNARNIDGLYRLDLGNGEEDWLFLEADGETHYLLRNVDGAPFNPMARAADEYVINSATARRDAINRLAIREWAIARQNEVSGVRRYYYLKVPFYATNLRELIINEREMLIEVRCAEQQIALPAAAPAVAPIDAGQDVKIAASNSEPRQSKKGKNRKKVQGVNKVAEEQEEQKVYQSSAVAVPSPEVEVPTIAPVAPEIEVPTLEVADSKAESRQKTKKAKKAQSKENKGNKGNKGNHNEEDIDAILAEQKIAPSSLTLQEQALSDAIAESKAALVKEILTTEINSNGEFGSFLNHAVCNLLNSKGKKFEENLKIVDDLYAAGADYVGDKVIGTAVDGRKFFAKAVDAEKYNAASFIISRFPPFRIEENKFSQITAEGSAELVFQVCQQLFRNDDRSLLNNDFWVTFSRRNDSEEIIEKLIMQGISPTDTNSQHVILLCGVVRRNENIVRALANRDLLHTPYKTGDHLLQIAVERDMQDTNILRILIEAKADPNLGGGAMLFSPIELACQHGGAADLPKLIRTKEDLLGQSPGQISFPLNLAIVTGDQKVVAALLRLARDKGITNYSNTAYDNTLPLHLAVRRDKIAIMTQLLAEGADVNAIDGSNNLPLGLAVKKIVVEGKEVSLAPDTMLGVLMAYNADPHRPDGKGKTPVGIAMEVGRLDIASALDIANSQRTTSVSDQEETKEPSPGAMISSFQYSRLSTSSNPLLRG